MTSFFSFSFSLTLSSFSLSLSDKEGNLFSVLCETPFNIISNSDILLSFSIILWSKMFILSSTFLYFFAKSFKSSIRDEYSMRLKHLNCIPSNSITFFLEAIFLIKLKNNKYLKLYFYLVKLII